MGLRISLADGEKLIINGAVLSADGRLRLVVENRASILRGPQIMSPDEANTPAKRLYYACMLAYIDEANVEAHSELVLALLKDITTALQSEEPIAICARIANFLASGNYYQALLQCRSLIEYEEGLL